MQIDANDYANDAGRAEQGIAYRSAIAQVGRTRSLSRVAVLQAKNTFRLKEFSLQPDEALETWSSGQNQGGGPDHMLSLDSVQTIPRTPAPPTPAPGFPSLS